MIAYVRLWSDGYGHRYVRGVHSEEPRELTDGEYVERFEIDADHPLGALEGIPIGRIRTVLDLPNYVSDGARVLLGHALEFLEAKP